MKDHLGDNVKEEMDNIRVPEDKLNHSIQVAIERGMKDRGALRKKWIYYSSAAVLLFGLLIGSALVSPAMANVVSKIPYLGSIFESKEDVVMGISEELREKGYPVNGIGVSFPEKVIRIGIAGDKDYFNRVKTEVEEVAMDFLQSRNYDAYTVKVSRYEEPEVPQKDKEIQQISEDFQLIDSRVREELGKRNIEVLQLGHLARPESIQIEIPNNTEATSDEIKEVVREILSENDIRSIPVEIKKVNMKKREQDRRWREILQTVSDDLLGKKDYKVRMVGYSVYPEPEIQAHITLSSKDENAKDFAKQLEDVIDEFLKSDQMKERIKGDPYHITIYSKDDKIIN
jgi:citrate lyase gamma subunit